MTHTVNGQKSLLARIRRIKGQAEALERLIEGGQDLDCGKVLQQIAAIRGAVAGLMAEVLEGHLREHVAADNITAEQRHEEIEQVVSVLRTYLK
jgi:DNA-binding FrmR family transcriptional regulator